MNKKLSLTGEGGHFSLRRFHFQSVSKHQNMHMHKLKKDLTINRGTMHHKAKLSTDEEDYSADNE